MGELTAEEKRLKENKMGDVPPWHKWGPYVSERSWGTVREDYSTDGDSWSYLPYEKAHTTAYRWGEDGIAGISDRYQLLCLGFAFWNGNDSMLKERLFGLAPNEGNHGEDVKECYYYLDNTPTHSYMKYLYKYPQAAFPYERLIEENQKRGLEDREFELVDTGVFEENRYFDVQIEYAKKTSEDLAVRIEIFNRGEEEASIHLLPQIWFRNTWSWADKSLAKPIIQKGEEGEIIADDSNAEPIKLLNFPYQLSKRYFYADKEAERIFTENETGLKDAFHRYVLQKEDCLKPEGTKAAFYFPEIKVPGKGSKVIRLRFSDSHLESPLDSVDEIVSKRKMQADEFYASLHPKQASEDEKNIQRQALSGMLWSKQVYLYDVNLWMQGDNPDEPLPEDRKKIRNIHWRHLISKRVLSMPDKWEYPWFAAWDLAFHSLALALVDFDFAKEQLWLLLFDQFQHPNGQIPAYEWEFSDLNPPVQAWAAWRLYQMEKEKKGKADRSFLKKCFNKLVINFVWWVNRVDAYGNNVFEGGFLGLDNITVIDRSAEIPGGGRLEQSDGTGWMGMFCLTLMRMALELSKEDEDYEVMATKFFEHYVYIAAALEESDNRRVQIWNEEDGFFYDVLSYPDGSQEQIKVRSLVGIIPLYAVDYLTESELKNFSEFSPNFHWFMRNREDLTSRCITPVEHNGEKKYLLALVRFDKMKRVLSRVWDHDEFHSRYGLRSLSKYHEKNPYELLGNVVNYEPGESLAKLKGGNSNWRGPIWFPTSFLFIDALKKLDELFGDDEKILDNLSAKEMAKTFSHNLIDLFRSQDGRRPIFGTQELFQNDPHFKDHLLFFEHYHGDNGRGLGASHQTGWSGLVANLIDEWL